MTLIDRFNAATRYGTALSLVKRLEKTKGSLSILDAGGGGGGFAVVLRKRGHRVVTCDKADAEVICDIEERLPFGDKTFDLVVSLAVLEHLRNWRQALEEFKRVGEAVIITTPSVYGKPVLEFLSRRNLVNREHIKDHKYYPTRQDIEEAGYEHDYYLAGLTQKGTFRIPTARPDRLSLIALLFFIVSLFKFPFIPNDDLLRHLTAYKYSYDYSQVYVHAYSPSYDPYIAFDYLAGLARQTMGGHSYLLFQCLASLLIGAGFLQATKAVPENLRASFLILLLYVLRERITGGRPAIILAGLFFLLWVNDHRLKSWLKAVIGAVVAPFYWLFFVYLIPLVMKDRVYLFSLIAGLLFWTLYGGAGYFESLTQIYTGVSARLMKVGEGAGIAQIVLYLPMFYPLFANAGKDPKGLLAIGYFGLFNQIRYIDTIIPLAFSYVRFLSKDLHKVIPICLLPLLLMAPVNPLNDFSFLKGRTVLCDDLVPMYKVMYTAFPVKVAPSMELGWTDRDVQEMIRELRAKGLIDSKRMEEYGFDTLVEKNMTTKTVPEGLELEATVGAYRVWKVVRP